MTYKLLANSDCIQKILDDGTVIWVPPDMANRDWKEYQDWLALGNEPEPAD